MNKFIIFALSVLIHNSATAGISRRPLVAPEDPQTSIQSEDRVAMLEREVQSLLGRVEVLEHSVSQLRGVHSKQTITHAPESKDMDLDATPHESRGSNASQPFKSPAPNAAVVASKSSGNSEKNSYDAALLALKDSQYEDAEAKFADFIQKYPKSSMLSNAYFWHGETFFRRNNYEKAAISYLKGYKQFPKASKASDSLLKLSLSLGAMKKTKEACSMLNKLDLEFKDRPANSIKRASDAKNKYGCK
jgi:tol-pal system protein YbgF